MLTVVLTLLGSVIGLGLGFVSCFFIDYVRYDDDDERWAYDELLYEGVVALGGVVGGIIALRSVDPVLALWSQFWA